MLKRVVTYIVGEDGRKKILSISCPVDTNGMELADNEGFISADFVAPHPILGRKTELYYNAEAQLVEVEYVPALFSDLSADKRLNFLYDQLSAAGDVLLEICRNVDVDDASVSLIKLYAGAVIRGRGFSTIPSKFKGEVKKYITETIDADFFSSK